MQFTAPWSITLKLITLFISLLLITIAILGIFNGPRNNVIWFPLMVIFPLLLVITLAFFTIRGYVIIGDKLLIRRIGWNSTVNLAGLKTAVVMADAMDRSIRTFGNGGVFCFAGKFRNQKLGAYRAFATDPKRSVVLKWPHSTVVVTPGQPDLFVAELQRQGLILPN